MPWIARAVSMMPMMVRPMIGVSGCPLAREHHRDGDIIGESRDAPSCRVHHSPRRTAEPLSGVRSRGEDDLRLGVAKACIELDDSRAHAR
jgi:hypothetical protein